MTIRDAASTIVGERIEFEEGNIAWAYTCVKRLMRRQSAMEVA